MFISSDIKYVGVNDHSVDLFEGQYRVPSGMSYNSYVVVDDKIAVFDSVDAHFVDEWLLNVESVIGDRQPDYLIVQHMEPDHSAGVLRFANKYPNATIVASLKAFQMMTNFFGTDFADRHMVVSDNDTLCTGEHIFMFVTAPMVHWPEVIMSHDMTNGILFSADAFGKFGALDVDEDWTAEARRYYIGIVGKYGVQVQNLFKKVADIDIAKICPLHGPVLDENLPYYLDLYNKWSSYQPEADGVYIAYCSIYGNTKHAVELLAEELDKRGQNVVISDLAREDMANCIANAFRHKHLVLASPTYNGDVFPYMTTFIHGLKERNFKNHTVAFMQNGSWAPLATKVMKASLESLKGIEYCQNSVTILSAVNTDTIAQINALADELSR